MNKSWLPLKNETFRSFCQAFLATITPGPVPFGLAVGDVTSLTAAVTSYSDALAVTDEPSTRTRVSVAARDMSKRSLIALMRSLYKRSSRRRPRCIVQHRDRSAVITAPAALRYRSTAIAPLAPSEKFSHFPLNPRARPSEATPVGN